MATGYDPPSWAGKPSVGLHLDVLKESKLIQKLMIDEKKCYLFGRNPHLNDFCIDHGSCSRVHAALVWHKHLERSFLVDLGSSKFFRKFLSNNGMMIYIAHGTFIGNFRIEANKPTQLPVDSTFRFGESTRKYIMRERPKVNFFKAVKVKMFVLINFRHCTDPSWKSSKKQEVMLMVVC